MKFRGVRGAITADANTADAILGAARQLMTALIEANGIEEDDVASVIFTTTADLTAAYPAKAARELGWRRTALLGAIALRPDLYPDNRISVEQQHEPGEGT